METANTEIRIEQMKNIDPRTVDRKELVDINEVKINSDLNQKDRMVDFIRQIKNPYCYLDHGMVVKVSFAGEKSLEECLAHYIHTIEE